MSKTGKLINQDFVVIDCETTGLNTSKDRILSLAAIPVRNGGIVLEDSCHWIVKQEASLAKSSVIHGLMPGVIADGVPEEDMLRELEKLTGDAAWVGHHIAFDVEMIKEARRRYPGKSASKPIVDTARLYHRLTEPGHPFKEISLDDLAVKLNVPASGRHTAAGDALTTANIFIRLLRQAERKGISGLKELKKQGGNPFFRW